MGDTITKTAVQADQLAPAERAGAYDEVIDGILITTFLAQPVFYDFQTCYLGPLRVIECSASARRSERTVGRITRDRYDGVSVQLAVKGIARGTAGAAQVASTPGTVMVLDFAQPFAISDEGPRDVINIAIPRVMLRRHIPDIRALHGLVLDRDKSAILAAHIQSIIPRLATLPVGGAAILGDIFLQLFLLSVGYDPASVAAPPADRRQVLTDRAIRIIEGRLGAADLTPEWLMSKLNVSRSELYSLFEDHGGVARFIWRRRLDGAHTALRDSRDSRRISAIAFAFGFTSEAHFAPPSARPPAKPGDSLLNTPCRPSAEFVQP